MFASKDVFLTPPSGGYTIARSVRLRSSASAYLNRTFGSGSQQKWTFSTWMKLGGAISGNTAIFVGGTTSSNFCSVAIDGNNNVSIFWYVGASTIANVATSAKLRDPSAWYHLVVTVDTTQATAANRIIVYLNGVQQTSYASTTYPSQNYNGLINSNIAHYIGQYGTAGYNNFDGYLTEINFIDGQALTPSSFGTTNAITGVWQPITYGGSYGTNGFYLPFKTNGSTYVGSFSGSWLTLASNTAFNVFGGDMTVECWFNATSVSGSPHLFAFVQDATNRESIYFNSSALTFYSSSSAGSGNRIATGTISTGVWYHYALVKSGSTFTMYLNGVSVGTSTTTQYSTANQSLQIGTYNSGSYGGDNFSGYISNVRVVKGTAVYTSNFIPPTANLSVVTNTQLLTLQNATIIDNSTNAFSITNTNTVTTGLTYPFSASLIFNDQSPQGNNWTPNNISVTAGVTDDSMVDSPTLTSATVANYAVLNPLVKRWSVASETFSNGNLTVTNAGASNDYALGTTFVSSGQYYWEVTATTVSGSFAIGVDNGQLQNSVSTNTVFYNNDGTKSVAGSGTSYGSTYTSADVIGVALDKNANTVTFYKNNTSQGSISLPVTTVPMGAAISPGSSGGVANINFGQQPFTYTPPTGFVALNTYNLPAGTITTSGSFTGNVSTDGPFVYLNGVPTAMTINGNAVTFGTNADKLANGFKVRSSSSSYNASGSNTYSITTTGAKFKNANAQTNP